MAQPVHELTPALEQRLSRVPHSPLFARLASHYLQAERAQEALRICDEGLAQYPFYSTGHLIKGKVLLELKMLAEAKREFEVVLELLPENEAAKSLCSSIDLGPSADLTTPLAAEQEPPESLAPPSPEEPTVEVAGLQETVTEEPSVTPTEPTEAELAATQFQESRPEGMTVEETPVALEETPTVTAETPAEEPFGFGAEPSMTEPEMPVAEFGEQIQPEVTADAFGLPIEPSPSVETEPEVSEAPPVPEPESYADFKMELADEAPVTEITPIEPAEPLTPVLGATTEEAPSEEGEKVPEWFEAFNQLQQTAEETIEPIAEPQAQEESPFAMFGTEAEPPATEAPVEGERFEEFSARMRMELFGEEDTMSLDDYLRSAGTDQKAAGTDDIEELAEKLKTPKKITPVINFAEKESRPASVSDTPSSTGFVTPTLAEIYVKQGWYDDAIKAYRALATSKPAEQEKYLQRIAEIEEMKKQQE
jgi:tetratricopeptide (TPR) repeat protein